MYTGKETQKSKCVAIAAYNETECAHKTRQVDKKCVEMLGGDAVDTTRYIIGSVVLALAIITDLVVRFCSKPQVKDEYAHL